MEVQFRTPFLAELERGTTPSNRIPSDVARIYAWRLQTIRAAVDEGDLSALKSNHFYRFQGERSHQHFMQLSDQFWLILEVKKSDAPGARIVVVDIESRQ
jgi:plasmid maintenance system killer protein